ncbi:MAG: chemotaxis response regulator protein-glutamate methylesterase [Candidatus Woesearchaeota archaeon]
MIRVIVTDDSAFMCKLLSDIINSDPELEVVATARDGKELLEKLEKNKPDLVTLDISMPVMDGITALKEIMNKNPLPVIMISSLADEENTFTCLELGAVDFIPKTSGIISIDMNKKKDIIINKIKAAFSARLDTTITEQSVGETKPYSGKYDQILCIGASTGGPKAIESVLQGLPGDFPLPVLIVQHLPEEFTLPFSKRLDRLCALKVKEAENHEAIKPGVVYVAPGDFHMEIKKEKVPVIKLTKDLVVLGVRPSVDVMMKSAAEIYGEKTIGVLLTGMGKDGAEGMKLIKDKNGETIVQDETTSIVPGMPRAAIKLGAATEVVPLSSIAKEVLKRIK